MTDPNAFMTVREFAAWIGLVPRQNSSGGKRKSRSISKQGAIKVSAATTRPRCNVHCRDRARTRPDKYPWVTELLGRRPAKVVAVAQANKMARIAWALLAKGEIPSGTDTPRKRRCHRSGGGARSVLRMRLRRERTGTSRVMMFDANRLDCGSPGEPANGS